MAQVRVRKRGKTFSYIFEAGKVDGRRKVVEKGGYPTKGAAYKAGVAAYNDFLHGNIGITSESITLADFMTAWLNNVVALNVKPTTLQTYRSVINVRILPYLGDVLVQKVTPVILDKWIRKLVEKGFSHSSLKVAHAVIHEMLDYAVYPAQIISFNPAAYIKIPKNAPKNLVKRTIISKELFLSLLAEYPMGTPYHVPILLLFCTGIRIGELIGLTWDDVDFERKTISIRKQMVCISKCGQVIAPPKSKSGIRDISVGDSLLTVLKEWQALQRQNEITFGATYVYIYRSAADVAIAQSKSIAINLPRLEFICTQADGRLLNRRSLMRLLKNKDLNAHSFRHTHATILAENGAHPKGMASRLGHSKINITQDLYVHNTQGLQEGIAVIFDRSLQTMP
ncbi:MAG: site-specific integrase [Selenomonadaceae bacterium]|nr:site-specific integrase [Selenomonadaceae bacterium]